MTDEERIRRAQHARQLTEDELYREAWSALEKNLMDRWLMTKPAETQVREDIWHALQAHKAHRRTLENFMADGRVAEANIQRKAKERATGRPAAI